MPEYWLEKSFGAFLAHSPKTVQRLVLRLLYWLMEEIDGYLPPTTSAKMTAGSAVAAAQRLKIPKALEEPTLPRHISGLLAAFEPDEWRVVLQIAVSDDSAALRAELAEPQWAHLRGDSPDALR
jgi:hypothetical protein